MEELVKGSERVFVDDYANPALGRVRWKSTKSLWISVMTTATLLLAPIFFNWTAFFIFLSLTAITLCAGHSVGMHRRLIHNSFDCPLWLEYCLVYAGVLVGMAGPIGMMKQHDIRDWAQRQSSCHDYLCHRRNIVVDYFWQCHCDLELTYPPRFKVEERILHDRLYLLMERYWMLHQLPLALLLFAIGGLSWVIWGVAVRITVGVTGHWLVGYFAHHTDNIEDNVNMSWRILGASVQGRDVAIAGLISMGESWHNNHHAYPGSAKIGILPGQPDPGYWLIKLFERFNLAWNIIVPDKMSNRDERIRIYNPKSGWSICALRKYMWHQLFGSAR